MASKPAPVEDGLEELRTLIRKGRVFEVQAWISEERPVFVTDSRKAIPLLVAVEKGVHSMVKVLAVNWPDRRSLNAALQQAAYQRRADLVWLLLKHGADMTSVYLGSIADCCDKDLMRHFLEHWEVVGGKDGLVDVVAAMPRPLIGLIRDYAKRIPNYEFQLSEALCYFVEEDHPKWIALSMWMGANPRLRVPSTFLRNRDEPEKWMSSIEMAVWRGKLQSLKIMKPDRAKDDLTALLTHVCRPECSEAGEYLLSLGANVNDKPNGGSSVLDHLFWPEFDFTGYGFERRFDYRQSSLIQKWIDLGAKFVPEDCVLREARTCISLLSSYQLEAFIKTLLKGTRPETVVKLFDTQKLRRKFGLTSKQLGEKIQAMLKKEEAKMRPPKPAFVDPPEGGYEQRRPRVSVTKRVVISRSELYEKVWATPVLQLAKQFGISDVGLAKACKRHKIPRPGLGYWAKKTSGYRVTQVPLKKPDWNPEITLSVLLRLPPIPDPALREQLETITEPFLTNTRTIEVLDSQPPHPLLVQETSSQSDGRKTQDQRYLRVMNAILNVLDSQGFPLKKASETSWTESFSAMALDREMTFCLRRESHRLALDIHGPSCGLRNTWRDGKRNYVENCIAEFVCTLACLATLQAMTA